MRESNGNTICGNKIPGCGKVQDITKHLAKSRLCLLLNYTRAWNINLDSKYHRVQVWLPQNQIFFLPLWCKVGQFYVSLNTLIFPLVFQSMSRATLIINNCVRVYKRLPAQEAENWAEMKAEFAAKGPQLLRWANVNKSQKTWGGKKKKKKKL